MAYLQHDGVVALVQLGCVLWMESPPLASLHICSISPLHGSCVCVCVCVISCGIMSCRVWSRHVVLCVCTRVCVHARMRVSVCVYACMYALIACEHVCVYV